jgi:ABC-type multidrug transport system fused ATPase/permease subunit
MVPAVLQWLRPDCLVESFSAVKLFYSASPRLTLVSFGLATLSGLLAPISMLATGALVQAISDGGAGVLPPLLALAAIFACQRLIEPIREMLNETQWPRIDEWLGDRIMTAVSAPAGLQELEDPTVLDKIAQARGVVTGYSPGQAAQEFGSLWVFRVQGLCSLAILVRWYWWAALFLALVYVLAFNATRWHWHEVTVVMAQRTDRLRRSYYLRGLALSSAVAKETRIFDLANWLVDRYRHSSLDVLSDIWQKRNEGWQVAFAVIGLVGVAEAALLLLVIRDTLAGALTLATAVTVTQAVLVAGQLSRYEEPDWGCTWAARTADTVAQLEASTRHIRTVTSGSRSADGLPRQHIRFENVTFAYPGGTRPILDAFNLEIAAGHSMAIVGENGAGKTTLVKLLTRLYDPTEGRITVDGVDLREIEPAAWHARASALFQDFARFEMSAYDNVAFGALYAYDNAAGVRRAALDAGIADVVERLSQGWQTRLSREFRQGAELSGGEWQRIALARALFGVSSGAGLLILDEPTASMDVRGEAEIYDRFLELTRGVTTIVISHRFSTVRRADRIVVVEGGRVIEDGAHADLAAKPDGRYARMYRLQAARFAECC